MTSQETKSIIAYLTTLSEYISIVHQVTLTTKGRSFPEICSHLDCIEHSINRLRRRITKDAEESLTNNQTLSKE